MTLTEGYDHDPSPRFNKKNQNFATTSEAILKGDPARFLALPLEEIEIYMLGLLSPLIQGETSVTTIDKV